MKTRNSLLGAFAASLILILLGGCAPGKYAPQANEEVYGTWTNPKSAQQKWVYLPDGTWKAFTYPGDAVPVNSGTYQLVKKWKDAEGNIWYHENMKVLVGVYKFNAQVLARVDKAGKRLESIFQEVGQFDSTSYPAQLDSKSESYSISYRSEEK
jgi:hypothetical protein